MQIQDYGLCKFCVLKHQELYFGQNFVAYFSIFKAWHYQE